ncbi:MAG: cellulose biosynthesis protein BcsD [Succinivibrio sp.]
MAETGSYRSYMENVSQPPGWFDFAVVIIGMIAVNARSGEDQEFLAEAGARVADLYPLPEVDGIDDLTLAVNSRLDAFKWGMARIEDTRDSLTIDHSGLPQAADPALQSAWSDGFCSVLRGLYAQWLYQSGAPSDLTVTLERTIGPSEAVFRLRKA